MLLFAVQTRNLAENLHFASPLKSLWTSGHPTEMAYLENFGVGKAQNLKWGNHRKFEALSNPASYWLDVRL